MTSHHGFHHWEVHDVGVFIMRAVEEWSTCGDTHKVHSYKSDFYQHKKY